MNLSSDIAIEKAAAPAVAGTTEVETSAIDMQGFNGVMFVTAIPTIDAGGLNYLQGKQGETSGGSFAILAASAVTPEVNGDVVGLDIFQPRERFVKASVLRNTSSATETIIALKYKGIKRPELNDATPVIKKLLQSPAEGAAK